MKVGFPYIAFHGRLSANRGQLDISLEIALLAEDHSAVGTVASKVTKQQNARSQRTRPITLVGTAMRKGILAKTVPCRKIGARSSARTVVKVSLTSYGFAVIQSLMLWTVGHGKGRCTNPPVESGDGGFGSGGGWDNAGGFDNSGGSILHLLSVVMDLTGKMPVLRLGLLTRPGPLLQQKPPSAVAVTPGENPAHMVVQTLSSNLHSISVGFMMSNTASCHRFAR